VVVIVLDFQLPVQLLSESINTKSVSSNPAHGEVYWKKHYVHLYDYVLTAIKTVFTKHYSMT
jgi:hypothetical protein